MQRSDQRFQMKSGSPNIVNTSFNVRVEPILWTLQDAYSFLDGCLGSSETNPLQERAIKGRKI